MSDDLRRLLPVAIPIAAAVLALLADALFARRALAMLIAVAALAATLLSVPGAVGVGGFASEVFGLEPISGVLVACAAAFSLGAIGLFVGYLRPDEDEFPAETLAFILLVPAGAALLAGARNLIVVFLGIELLSIPLYTLVALRRRRAASVEGALKYFLLGSFAAGFITYGAALLFAGEGTLQLSALAGASGRSVAGAAGAALVFAGLLFKVSAAPFHFWTPDAYEGAPTPVTALMASTTKIAAIAAFLVTLPLLPVGGGTVLGVIAVLSIAAGNFGALLQDRVKRMLAYSAVAHAGTILLALAVDRTASAGPMAADISRAARGAAAFYLAAYGAAALGAFGVLAILERGGDRFATLQDFRGLSRRRPLLAWLLVFFLLSFGGIPPTGGFWAKYLVFAVAVRADQIALATAGIVLSVVGVAFYLRVVAACFLSPAGEGEGAPAQGRTPIPALLVTLGTAAAVLVLGVLPSALLDSLAR